MRQPAQGPARLLLASPTLADVESVASLLRAYAPERLVALRGVSALPVEACARALGIEMRQLQADPDAPSMLDVVVADGQGSTVALLVPLEALPHLVSYALGVSDEAGVRFAFAASAISVLECDADGRWAVVRVNEGAWPPAPR